MKVQATNVLYYQYHLSIKYLKPYTYPACWKKREWRESEFIFPSKSLLTAKTTSVKKLPIDMHQPPSATFCHRAVRMSDRSKTKFGGDINASELPIPADSGGQTGNL